MNLNYLHKLRIYILLFLHINIAITPKNLLQNYIMNVINVINVTKTNKIHRYYIINF